MLLGMRALEELDFPELMAVYEAGNRENGEYFYPEESPERQMLLAQRDFRKYLTDGFFAKPDVSYWIWQEDGTYMSALRLEPEGEGLLLEALETRPGFRQKGYAKKLIRAVLDRLPKGTEVHSHVSRENTASLATHYACGFVKACDFITESDGRIRNDYVTMSVTV